MTTVLKTVMKRSNKSHIRVSTISEDESESELMNQNKDKKNRPECWLSTELRLDSYSVKEELFTITGWINVHWKWTDNVPELAEDLMKMNYVDAEAKNETYKIKMDENGPKMVEISDLRESEITALLPIDATKIFNLQSLDSIEHIDPPFLEYNKQSEVFHTQYYVKASLNEDLELFAFPFDRQFINVKLRFQFKNFHLLDYKYKDRARKQFFSKKHAKKKK
eukprot:9143_1